LSKCCGPKSTRSCLGSSIHSLSKHLTNMVLSYAILFRLRSFISVFSGFAHSRVKSTSNSRCIRRHAIVCPNLYVIYATRKHELSGFDLISNSEKCSKPASFIHRRARPKWKPIVPKPSAFLQEVALDRHNKHENP
jgi:hypothetical protein